MKKNILLLILMLTGFGLSACGVSKASTATPDPSASQPTTTPEVFMPLPADQRAFEAVRSVLAQQLGVDPLTISLLKVEPVDWPNSCLGVAGRDEMCAQMITPGFRVTVKQSNMVFEFHTDQGAKNIRQVNKK